MKFMNIAPMLLSSGVAAEASGSAGLGDFVTTYIVPVAGDIFVALIAAIGSILAAAGGFLGIKYGLPVALAWLRKMVKQG